MKPWLVSTSMNPYPCPLPSDGRGRVIGRLAGKVSHPLGNRGRLPSLPKELSGAKHLPRAGPVKAQTRFLQFFAVLNRPGVIGDEAKPDRTVKPRGGLGLGQFPHHAPRAGHRIERDVQDG